MCIPTFLINELIEDKTFKKLKTSRMKKIKVPAAKHTFIVRRTSAKEEQNGYPSQLQNTWERSTTKAIEQPPPYQFEGIYNIPGVANITHSSNHLCYRSLWGIILLASLVACAYQVTERISLYIRRPITSRTIITRNDSIRFPSFSVCPYPLTIPKARELFFPNETNQLTMPRMPGKHMEDFIEHNKLDKWEKYKNLDSLIKSVGLRVNLNEVNNFTETKTHWTSYWGNCTMYTYPDLIPFMGRALVFDLIVVPYDNEIFGIEDIAPVIVFFHTEDEDIQFNIYNGDQVDFTFAKQYAITIQKFDLLNTTNRPCDTMRELKQCRSKCIDDILKQSNVCSLPMFHDKSFMKPCSEVNESKRAMDLFQKKFINLDYHTTCHCLRPCKDTIYSMNMYKFEFFSSNRYQGRYTAFFPQNTITILKEEELYSFIACLCDVGGNMGLFLGLSIPSILEVLEAVVIYWKQKTSLLTQKH